jgi:hypothetical protein
LDSRKKLHVVGYRRVVSCTFFRQEEDTDHISVLFPGFSYSDEMPLLYYPRQLLRAAGADVFAVGYNYSENPDFLAASPEERDLWLKTDAIAAYEIAVSQRDYERVTLVGKSIGTRAIGYLMATQEHFPSLGCVWLTPILRNETLCVQMKHKPHRALFVAGTADSEYIPERLAEIQQATKGQALILENADHSLEIEGDIVRSVRVHEGVISEIERFLGRKEILESIDQGKSTESKLW